MGDSGGLGKDIGGGCLEGLGALALLKPLGFLRSSVCGGGRYAMNDSGLATLGAGSSKNWRPTLEGLRESSESDVGGLERELAALLKPELKRESSERPESEGVCIGFAGKSFPA